MGECLGLGFFFFNDTATTEIYTLSLHDALPISAAGHDQSHLHRAEGRAGLWRLHERGLEGGGRRLSLPLRARSEEHTSELQSPCNLVCRLLLEKKKLCPQPMNSDCTIVSRRTCI